MSRCASDGQIERFVWDNNQYIFDKKYKIKLGRDVCAYKKEGMNFVFFGKSAWYSRP